MILEPLGMMRKYNESNKKIFIQSFVSNINDNSSCLFQRNKDDLETL